jgi:hypothetical protein
MAQSSTNKKPVEWPERLSRKYADRVASVIDERGMGDGVWFYLKPGWVTDDPAHVVHVMTLADAESRLGPAGDVESGCNCERCVERLAKEKA